MNLKIMLRSHTKSIHCRTHLYKFLQSLVIESSSADCLGIQVDGQRPTNGRNFWRREILYFHYLECGDIYDKIYQTEHFKYVWLILSLKQSN